MDLFTYPKAGFAAGANAVAEATTAAKQNAVFMVKSSQPNGPVLGGFIFDRTGGYGLMYIICAGMGLFECE